jgi:exodeoxyribonuclease X
VKAIIFDCETTGLDEPQLVQSAYIPIGEDLSLLSPTAGDAQCNLWKPSKPIGLGALATHHIMDEDLVDAPSHTDFKLPEGVQYLIGHNVDFDWQAIGSPSVRRICTLAMSRKLWPDADSHSLGAMLYLTRRSLARSALRRAHDALQDCWNCFLLLQAIGEKHGPFYDLEAAWKFSEVARIPDRMNFGKHKGTAIKDVPPDYKRWLLNQPDVDPYLAKALRA